VDIIRRHFDIIDSTNTWAKHNAHLLPLDKITLVTAEGQTAGRGRYKRHWESPPGQNIYASFCFFLDKQRLDKQRLDIGNIPQVLALSTVSLLEKLGFRPELKWPNDVLLSKKKVAGILTEAVTLSDQMCLIVGIGLNVNMTPEYIERIDRPATSLLAEKGHLYDIEDLLHVLRQKFTAGLKLFIDEGFAPFYDTYRKYVPFNEQVRFHDNLKLWEGTIHDIKRDGSLVLKLANGTSKTFIAGEILFEDLSKSEAAIKQG
jgi:BirA family biotin operon repressor/biotin-[acetyl-CoA-carboxylase] ligase